MDLVELTQTLVGLFSGGLTGAVSNLILLAAIVILAVKIRSFLKKKTAEDSQKQAKDDRSSQLKDNQTKDNAQADDETDLDNWRREVRDEREKD
jgi:predicted lipid-binding transport protein (Tim44 family)